MPPPVPSLTITVQSQGGAVSISVPSQRVQLKVGVAIGATANVPVASSSLTVLQTALTGGPLLEAAGLIAKAGNIPVCVPIPVVTLGSATAVEATVPGGSTSTVTVTTDSTYGAWDTYFVEMLCLTSGTIGTAPGPLVQFSGDAGRNWGTPVQLGTATTYYLGSGVLNTATIGGTGVSMAFGAGTMVKGDFWKFSTTQPQGNAAGIVAALAAFQASQYGKAGVGSCHIVGDVMHGGSSTDDIASIETQLDAGLAFFQYDRAIVELRDAKAPAAWGGSGETEATWIAALQTAMSGLTAARVCPDGGNYNMTSAFANAAFGLPAYRRNLAWAHAVIRTQIQPQQRAGRQKNNNQPYQQIVVNSATDPADGFIYHDDSTTPGLAISRIACAMSWPGTGGFSQATEPLLCANGSQISELVIGNVADIACDISYAQGRIEISDDLILQANGTLSPGAITVVNGGLQQALNDGLTAPSYVSSVTSTVSPTQNVLATGTIPITVGILRKGYVDSENITIYMQNGSTG